jgi:hypothetical protein
MPPIGARQIMSETINALPKSPSTQDGTRDGRVLAQVERWMAMIREISREQIKN